ncbi:hypothetical protein RJT34_21516 [Clitoria ternatea]|uniref:DEAD/DEAH-box helicase domain-containing protein n=1 Tax=Clitoria ternatea TaxID=43366 RepID=A0AAN9P5V4_CLITE
MRAVNNNMMDNVLFKDLVLMSRASHNSARTDMSSQLYRIIIDSEEADKYMHMVKEQQQRGLQKLKGGRESKDGGFSYKVDPYTLHSGDYVMHNKVSIGIFVGIKFDVQKNSTEPIEYAFIDPNENKKLRALSKLSDTSAWEKQKIKGKAFIDVEKDLTERETPMDRLIYGDVGFGKTEVALCVIFCVVASKKQAMVLAPTIVLAKQHFDVI